MFIKNFSLPLQVGMGMLLGIITAVCHLVLGWDTSFVIQYIKPLGSLFVNSLKSLSVPLVVTGIIHGISGIENTKKLSKIFFKALGLYVITTILAVCIGLTIAGWVQPGKKFPKPMQERFAQQCITSTEVSHDSSHQIVQDKEIIPDNFLMLFADNSNLLFIVLFAVLFSLALLNVDDKKRKFVLGFYNAMNDVFREIVKLIMRLAPIGIFSLTCSILIEQTKGQDFNSMYSFFIGVGWYTATVLGGLVFMMFFVYPILGVIFTKTSWSKFIKSIYRAQLIAFTTSSSSAALPVTISCAEKLGINKTIRNFVLSIGATVNVDGTVLYQAIAVSFIAQAYGVDIYSIPKMLTIIAYLTSFSFGLGGLPGVSLGATSIVLRMLGIPNEALGLIIMVDRIVDMTRSSVNITSDLWVTSQVDKWEGKKLGTLEE